MRFGVDLPGPFWASFRVGGRRRRGGGVRGPGGCLMLLLFPFYLLMLLFQAIIALYKWAWAKPETRRGKVAAVSGVSLGLLAIIIIGSATGGSSSNAPGAPTAVATSSAPTMPTPTAMVTVTVTPTPHPSATPTHMPTPTHSAYVAPTHTAAPTHHAYVAPTHIAAPAPTQAPAPSCYPQTSSGHCYEPGEFCPAKDQGMSGVAGDGKSITCEDNNGLRWED